MSASVLHSRYVYVGSVYCLGQIMYIGIVEVMGLRLEVAFRVGCRRQRMVVWGKYLQKVCRPHGLLSVCWISFSDGFWENHMMT